MPKFNERPEWNILTQRLKDNDPTLVIISTYDVGRIGNEGMKQLSIILKDNCTLTELHY
jgi:hypothetical protein